MRADMINHSNTTACVVALLAAACAGTGRLDVPATLEPGPNEALYMIASARGVQIYECRARTGGATGEHWAFVAPEAELIDARGRSIGRHGAGPYWQANDGSRVAGTLKSRADAPVAGAIPWLLLAATPAGAEGRFGKVSSIQRVNTAGGLAPASGCDRDAIGTPIRIPYTADYYFFAAG
jgi:hypothetical protein